MIKKTFYLLTIITFLLFFNNHDIHAQSWKIGVKGGFSIPSLTQQEDNIFADGFESSSNFETGILAEFRLAENWSIQPELLYAVRGGKKNGLQAIPPDKIPAELAASLPQGVVPYANFNNESTPTYLEIPILLKYGWGDIWRFYINGGPYLGLLIKAKQKTSGTSTIFLDSQGQVPLTIPLPSGPTPVIAPFDEETDAKEDLENVNFGFHAGIGIIRKLNEKSEFFFDIRLSKGFIPIQKDEEFGKTTIGGLVFSLGYAYNFGK